MKHAVRKGGRGGTVRAQKSDATFPSQSPASADPLGQIDVQTPFMNAADVVAYLRGAVTVGTLANWRSKGKGPKPHKVGVKSLYLRREVDEFVLQQQEGAAAPPA